MAIMQIRRKLVPERRKSDPGPGPQKEATWKQPGPVAFDFHSDTITVPTSDMLNAMVQTTLVDDIYYGDPTTQDLEAHVARLGGHEAGLFMMSGTAGNMVALRSHLLFPPFSVLCDKRSHIAEWEAGGVSTLSGAHLITVSPSNNHHLTLEDIQAHIVISDDVHKCPTRVISLENTLYGMIMPLSEMRRISDWAHANNVVVHLDGARLWECVAAGAGELREFLACVDSATMCFSKGLGAPIGSVLVGSEEFVRQARRIRKMMGGAIRQAGVISAAARVALDRGMGRDGKGAKLRETHERAQKVASMWVRRGGKLQWPVETNMVWLDLERAGVTEESLKRIAQEENVHIKQARLIIHYQITDEALNRLDKVFERLLTWRRFPFDSSQDSVDEYSTKNGFTNGYVGYVDGRQRDSTDQLANGHVRNGYVSYGNGVQRVSIDSSVSGQSNRPLDHIKVNGSANRSLDLSTANGGINKPFELLATNGPVQGYLDPVITNGRDRGYVDHIHTNGYANGHTNGYMNELATGQAKGHANGYTNGYL